jgi:transcriptional regulator with XRE-family HTH domain
MEKINLNLFGDMIWARRLKLGINGKELIKRLGVNISSTYLRLIEEKGAIPRADLVKRFALVLGLDLKELFDVVIAIKLLRYEIVLREKYKE